MPRATGSSCARSTSRATSCCCAACLERIPVVEVDGEVVSELLLDEAGPRARLDTVGSMIGAGDRGACRRRGADRRRRAALARRRGAPLALSPGPHPGAQDGTGDDLLAGALRVHPHQPDPDPPRPLRLRQVRQARRRLQRRLAGRGDPQDPPHLRPAQHRPVRRRQPRPGDRQLRHLRRPRLPDRRHVRRRPRRGRHPGRRPRGARLRRAGGGRRRGGDRGRRARRSRRRRPGGRRPPRRGRRQDHLQLLRAAAPGAARR